jgi:Tol biopolymer transport system component
MNLYILPGSGSQLSQPPPSLNQINQINYFNWTPDGRLIVTDGARLLKTGTDGANQSQLLVDETARFVSPTPCGPELFVFSWAFQGGTNFVNIWRVNADGSGPIRLTDGKSDLWPVCSPDREWVYFYDNAAHVISRVRLDRHAKPENITAAMPPSEASFMIFTTPMSISADGETLAFAWSNSEPPSQPKIALANLKTLRPRQIFDAHPHFRGQIRFTPDGKSVAYVIRDNGVDNLWVQPIDGSPGHQIANFQSEEIAVFHWSADGENLGILRKKSESDVVLLQDSKEY